MADFFVSSSGPDDWQGFLSSPPTQWRTGYSAKTLAHCWEAARGFPDSVRKVFTASQYPRIQDMEFICGFPEHKTALAGGRRPSQSDLFVLARTERGLISITVEGKVNEDFGPLTGAWLKDDSPGKRERLADLRKRLRLPRKRVDQIRYQLLHRTASALIEAERFHAGTAIMLVHSFSQEHARFEDYHTFVGLLGKSAEPDTVSYIGRRNGIELYTAWVVGESEFLTA